MENYCFKLPLTALLVNYQTLGPGKRQRTSGESVSCMGGRAGGVGCGAVCP